LGVGRRGGFFRSKPSAPCVLGLLPSPTGSRRWRGPPGGRLLRERVAARFARRGEGSSLRRVKNPSPASLRLRSRGTLSHKGRGCRCTGVPPLMIQNSRPWSPLIQANAPPPGWREAPGVACIPYSRSPPKGRAGRRGLERPTDLGISRHRGVPKSVEPQVRRSPGVPHAMFGLALHDPRWTYLSGAASFSLGDSAYPPLDELSRRSSGQRAGDQTTPPLEAPK
jgi:hypothetical protein